MVWINAPNYADVYEKSIAIREQGTATWLIGNDAFKTWRHTWNDASKGVDSTRVLWVAGMLVRVARSHGDSNSLQATMVRERLFLLLHVCKSFALLHETSPRLHLQLLTSSSKPEGLEYRSGLMSSARSWRKYCSKIRQIAQSWISLLPQCHQNDMRVNRLQLAIL